MLSDDLKEKLDHGKVMVQMFFKNDEVTFEVAPGKDETLHWIVKDYRDPSTGKVRNTAQKRTYKNIDNALDLIGRLCETARQPMSAQPMTEDEDRRFSALLSRMRVINRDYIMVGSIHYDGLRGMSIAGKMRKPFIYHNICAVNAKASRVRFATIDELEAFAEDYFKILPSRKLALGYVPHDRIRNMIEYWCKKMEEFVPYYDRPKAEVVFGYGIPAHVTYGKACYLNLDDVVIKMNEDVERLNLLYQTAYAQFHAQTANPWTGRKPHIYVEPLYYSDKMIELY